MLIVRWIAGLFSLAALGVVAAVGGLGLVIWLYGQDLPDTESLATYEPKTLTRVFSSEGELIGEFARERRIFTPIEEIPDLVKQAFISAEDKNFYNHAGIDALGIARAVVANAQALASGGGGIQGASTITQQVMKNFLLTSDRSIERKVKEAILSVRIEQSMSKDRILELYLNEIFLGQNAYGVAAAAQRYFGKTLEALTPAEAAYLAALPKAPSTLHPVRERERATERRNYVLREMMQNGVLTREEAEAARAEPLHTLFDRDAPAAAVASAGPPSYVTEDVRRRLGARLGEDALFEGGLTVRATVDEAMQAVAEDALRDALLAYDRENGGWRGPIATLSDEDMAEGGRRARALSAVVAARDIPGWSVAVVTEVGDAGAEVELENGETVSIPFDAAREWARPRLGADRLGDRPSSPSALWSRGDVIHVARAAEGEGWRLAQTPEVSGAFMAMDAATGRILAMQGGFSWMTSTFNRATQAQRQPGSTFKPMVYAAALEAGYTPDSVLLDAPIVVDTASGRWKPENSSGNFIGPQPLRVGVQLSRNAMTVRLAQEIGMDRVASFAERFGVYADMPRHLAYALGAGETTLEKVVAAYATFANGGVRVEPTLVDRVQDRRGDTIWRAGLRACPDCENVSFDGGPAPEPVGEAERILARETADTMVGMLRGVVESGTASRAFSGVDLPVAGKTGTTNDAKDVWFVGFTPEIVAGCYIGHDTPRPLGRSAFGGTICAPVVADFFRRVYENRRPPRSFEAVAIAAAETVAEEAQALVEAEEQAEAAPIEPAAEEPFVAAPGARAPSPIESRGFDRARGIY